MDFEYMFHDAGFILAFQMMALGSLIAPAAWGRFGLYHRFASMAASHVVSFGPPALLIYILYKVSHLV